MRTMVHCVNFLQSVYEHISIFIYTIHAIRIYVYISYDREWMRVECKADVVTQKHPFLMACLNFMFLCKLSNQTKLQVFSAAAVYSFNIHIHIYIYNTRGTISQHAQCVLYQALSLNINRDVSYFFSFHPHVWRFVCNLEKTFLFLNKKINHYFRVIFVNLNSSLTLQSNYQNINNNF